MKFVTSLAFSDPAHYCDLAVAAESAGWDGLAVSDHVVHPEKIASPYPYTEDGSPRWDAPAPWPEPFVAIGAMAAVTTRLRFVTSIYVLPLRDPFTVAKAAGTAAVMSGNRLSLGMGVGWMREEFELLGQSFARRGRRADEMVAVMRTLWQGGMVEYHGEFFDFERLQMSPAPSEPIPILVGGVSEPALRRVGRLGDGWISDIHGVDEIREIVAKLRAYRAEYGREHEPLEVLASCSDAVDVDGYRRLEDAGATTLQTMPWLFYGGPTDDLARKVEGLRRFGEDVIAKFR